MSYFFEIVMWNYVSQRNQKKIEAQIRVLKTQEKRGKQKKGNRGRAAA